jgi:hypothetical protein
MLPIISRTALCLFCCYGLTLSDVVGYTRYDNPGHGVHHFVCRQEFVFGLLCGRILCIVVVVECYCVNNISISSSSWVLQPDSSQDRLNYASPPDPIRRYIFPVSNPQCLQILLNIVQPSYWWSSSFPCSHWLTEG